MQLDEFLYNLHFDTDKVRPPNMAVDWDDAPLPFKLYQGLPVVPLSYEPPLKQAPSGDTASLPQIGHFLWHCYGLSQICHTQVPSDDTVGKSVSMQLLRRHVPSGGGLYPSELYIYLKTEDVRPGIYHYDVAHHRLVLLREGMFDNWIDSSLGYRSALGACFGAVFISTVFWKNFYKYNNFAYRLQALDAGALIGQIIEVGKEFGYDSVVYFQFLDKTLNYLLGLNDSEESTYAVIPLNTRDARLVTDEPLGRRVERKNQPSPELSPLHYVHYNKSHEKKEYPILIEMNQASMMNSATDFVQSLETPKMPNNQYHDVVRLPINSPLPFSSTTASHRRFSPALDFVSSNKQLHLTDLAVILSEAMRVKPYVTDVDAQQTITTGHERLSIACCVHGMDGLPDGAYLYDVNAHALHSIRLGDHRLRLQMGMTMHTVNLFQVPLCFHLIGEPDAYRQLGYRGYRVQQMEVGMVLQRLLLTVSHLGLGGHPLLDYDESNCDEIYHLTSQKKTCLIQISVGRYKKRSRFESTLRR